MCISYFAWMELIADCANMFRNFEIADPQVVREALVSDPPLFIFFYILRHSQGYGLCCKGRSLLTTFIDILQIQ